MLGRLLCFIGWHSWEWKLEEGETLYLNAPPPPRAICPHCGKRYGDK